MRTRLMPSITSYRPFLVLILTAGLCLALMARGATALETKASGAILVEVDSGAVLFEKNADEKLPPASMSKLMTAYTIFERLSEGLLQLDDTFLVSEKAWRMGGSKMWIEVGKRVRVEDLLRGLIIQSGNDAAVALAEGLSGSEEAFVEILNRKAKDLGLENSSFANATGWPHPNHRMTARDLALLGRRIILDFPDYYSIYQETEFTWNDITQRNRNPLLTRGIGADGIKTGHTSEAGYCLIASAERDGRRLLLVVMGLGSEQERAEEAERLLDWGFREFATYELLKPGEVVDMAPVWMGSEDEVPLVSRQGVSVNLLREVRDRMEVTLVYQSPLQAPIQAGQEVASLTVSAPRTPERYFPIVAAKSVSEAGILARVYKGLYHLIIGG